MALLPSFNVKDILELVKKGATVEAQEKIMELREAALGLQEENIKLKERLKALEEELKLKGRLRFDGKVYLLEKDDGPEDGPYCQLCYDGEHKLIRLQLKDTGEGREWYCLKCKEWYGR
jgi:hypothetical protein